MNEANENKTLVEFWSKVLTLTEEERQDDQVEEDDWKHIAASTKLFDAAASLGSCRKVLDYGCGNVWASIIAAKSGCHDITAVDVAEGAIDSASFYVKIFGLENDIAVSCVDPDYLQTVSDNTFDGIFCSNVIDVLPPATAESILKELARVATDDANIIIGMNYYMTEEMPLEDGEQLVNGIFDYVDGVLRMVSRTDEEWAEIFSKYFTVEKLDHYARDQYGETEEKRRLFFLKKKA